MPKRSHRRPLGESAAFLLRRIALAARAVGLLAMLAVLLVSAAVILLIRVGVRLLVVVWRKAWAVARRIPVLGRRIPSKRNRGTQAWDPIMVPRWLLAAQRGTLLVLREAAQTERRDIGRYLGVTISPAYHTARGDTRPSLALLLRDPATWRDLLYWVSAGALAIVTAGVVTAVWVFGPAVLAALPFTEGFVADMWPARMWLWLVLSSPPATMAIVGLIVAVGVTMMAPRLTRLAASTHAGLGEALLRPGGHARLQAELDEQRARRRLAVEAAEAERRRIERDLHDGAQQRLVSLAMNLGMARQKFASDPTAAEQLVADAHAEAKLALGELRALARGIHPAVLTDRGLDAALSALAGRVGVPVDVDVVLAVRPPTAVESAAYFVVAEALTNVARHASATRASVSIVEYDGRVIVEISDDGIGGADVAIGTGLAGLADRVDSIDGRMEVRSPLGGPTVVRAELPCAS